MVELSLECAIIGQPGTFDVTIDDGEKVSQLKDAIKEKNSNNLKDDDATNLQLFLAKTEGGAWLQNEDPCVPKLEEGKIHPYVQTLIAGEKMKANWTIKDVLDENHLPTPQSKQVHVLVVVPTTQPQLFPPFRPNAEGLNLETPHLSRDELVQKLYNGVMVTNVVLLGKTSLLTLFARRYPVFRYVTIAFYDPAANATGVLDSHGVDVVRKECRLRNDDDKIWVFMLDDCQQQYRNVAFWTQLVKDVPTSPVQFESISWKLTRDDFLISDVEAYECLAMENGLPALLQFPTLLEVIVRECNGHVGSLRVSINAIYEHFQPGKGHNLTEQEVLAYYLSGAFVNHMARCFGSKHAILASPDQQAFLAKCLVCDPGRQPLVKDLTRDEYQCLTMLAKTGIVTEVGPYVKFTSPVAERYIYQWLFPGRGYQNPTSLHELIRKAIGCMSASALELSVAHEDDFLTETVFQHQLMATLAQHTTSECYVCPELSRVFPASPRQPTGSTRADGEIDFYLNGSLRWGIELVVNGDKFGDDLSRFAAEGKYAALAAEDYAIIDFRGNKRGRTTNATRSPKRITVFFKLGDFSKCRCIFGLVEDQEPIFLKH